MIDVEEHDTLRAGSDRSFGLVFAAVFLAIALWPLINGDGVRWWSATVSAAFAIIAIVLPAILGPLNRLWFRFGLILGRLVSPVVMAIIFFVTVTPTALIFKLMKKDPLALRKLPDAASYWVNRDDSADSSMKNQF
jgi:predicted membrane metal-binding protein